MLTLLFRVAVLSFIGVLISLFLAIIYLSEFEVKITYRGYAIQWDDKIDGSDSRFCLDEGPDSEGECLFPQMDSKGNFKTGLLRRAIHTRFGTEYGCMADPTIRQMKGYYTPPGKEDFDKLLTKDPPENIQPNAPHPHRLSFLFLVADEMSHKNVWDDWFNEARKWSLDQFNKRSGPFSRLTRQQLNMVKDEDVRLFSVTTHFTFRDKDKNINKTLPIEDFPSFLTSNVVPTVRNSWGDLTAVEYQLLKYGLDDPQSNLFIFVSESHVPVKPFSYIYQQFVRNPRTRIPFAHVNLPMIQKHYQWIAVSRSHAKILVDHPEKWTCHASMVQPSWNKTSGAYAAGDEYLPFYVLYDVVGPGSIWEQINDGKSSIGRRFPILNWKDGQAKQHDIKFRTTWVCWDNDDNCSELGNFSGGPAYYSKVFAEPFKRLLIEDPNVWFARKFSSKCVVEVSKDRIENKTEKDYKIESDPTDLLDLGFWLKSELNRFDAPSSRLSFFSRFF